jgi:hypothetical protein
MEQARRFDFKIRDLLITQLPSGEEGVYPCSGHPIRTDFCGCPSDFLGDPAPDLSALRGLVQYAAARMAVTSFERQMKPLGGAELDDLEQTLASSLDAIRSFRKTL